MNIKFIGKIGVGKTTAICNLLNLTLDGKPILDVASGRTTICDVYIKKRSKHPNAIHVESYTHEEYLAALRNYFYKPHLLSTEVARAIENMAGISEISNQEIRFPQLSKLISYCRTKVKYQKRRQSTIINEDVSDITWIKNNFNLINTGHHELFGIPKEIRLHLDFETFKDSYHWVEGSYFIDTKGLDGQTNLRSNVSMKEVYCTSFVSGLENELKQKINMNARNINNKILLILARTNEPENVNGAEGNYESGMSIKRFEFERFTKGVINPKNIIIYDNSVESKNMFFNLLNNN